MKCPIDNTTLTITDRQGIEIDYCPECRGVWLDRGELDKIIDKSNSQSREVDQYREDVRSDRNYTHDNYYDKNHPKRKKRESFLSDLFDFGD